MISEAGENREALVKRLKEDDASYGGHVSGEHYLILDHAKNEFNAYQLKVNTSGNCFQGFENLALK